MKFEFGDLVRIKDELPSYKRYFQKGKLALIEGDYGEMCSQDGKSNYKEGGEISYSIFIKGHGSVAWYQEDDLVLVNKNQAHLFLECDKKYMSKEVRFLVERIKYFK